MVACHVASAAFLCLIAHASAFFPIHQASEQPVNRLGGVEYEASEQADSLRRRDEQGDAPGIFISIAPFRSNTHYRVRSPSKQQDAHPARSNQYQFVSANSPGQPNSVAIDEDGTDYSYFSAAGIGSKTQQMFLLVDTGSSVTWVMDESCTSGPCKSHNMFASSQSSSLKSAGSGFTLDYGTGEVSGNLATDVVSIAGLNVTTPIGLANTVSPDFQSYPFDGILGLGRIPLDGATTTTFVQELVKSKAMPSNVFGINLQRQADRSADGELNFGAPDTSKYQGDLNWTDTVSDKSFWQIPADDMLVDGKSVGLNHQRSAILDTGTSYMLIPPQDAKALFGAIKGATLGDGGFWNLPCDTKQDIQVVINGVGYSISHEDYVGNQANQEGLCVSNIVGMSAAGNDQTWLLGDTFLKNVYTVFDADKNRIGFGAKSGVTKVGSGSSSSSTATGSSTATSSTATGTVSGSASAKATISGGLSLPAAKITSSPVPVSSGANVPTPTSTAAPQTNEAGRHLLSQGSGVLTFILVVLLLSR